MHRLLHKENLTSDLGRSVGSGLAQLVSIQQCCNAGGLAAAFALQRAIPGIKVQVSAWFDSNGSFSQAPACHGFLSWPVGVQVFDSTKDFKLCGAGLGISVNGLKALRAISSKACQELESTSRKPTDNQRTLMYDDEGKLSGKHSGSLAAAHAGRPR